MSYQAYFFIGTWIIISRYMVKYYSNNFRIAARHVSSPTNAGSEMWDFKRKL